MPDWVAQALTMTGAVIGAGLSVYVAIRVDLAYIRATAENAKESAGEAHRRIDNFFDRRGKA